MIRLLSGINEADLLQELSLGGFVSVEPSLRLISDIMAFFQVSYIGKSYADPTNLIEIRARTVLATGIGVDMFESRLGLSFRVDDLLDTRGEDLLGFPLPGRRYNGRLSFRHSW